MMNPARSQVLESLQNANQSRAAKNQVYQSSKCVKKIDAVVIK